MATLNTVTMAADTAAEEAGEEKEESSSSAHYAAQCAVLVSCGACEPDELQIPEDLPAELRAKTKKLISMKADAATAAGLQHAEQRDALLATGLDPAIVADMHNNVMMFAADAVQPDPDDMLMVSDASSDDSISASAMASAWHAKGMWHILWHKLSTSSLML